MLDRRFKLPNAVLERGYVSLLARPISSLRYTDLCAPSLPSGQMRQSSGRLDASLTSSAFTPASSMSFRGRPRFLVASAGLEMRLLGGVGAEKVLASGAGWKRAASFEGSSSCTITPPYKAVRLFSFCWSSWSCSCGGSGIGYDEAESSRSSSDPHTSACPDRGDSVSQGNRDSAWSVGDAQFTAE